MTKKTLLLLTLYFILAACSKKTKIENYLNKNHSIKIKSQKAVIFITEENGCMNCNRSFAQFMEKYTSNENILFILSSDGSKIDISHYQGYTNKNVFYDLKKEFKKENITDKSSVIFLKNKEIDTSLFFDKLNLRESILRIGVELDKRLK